MRRRDFLRKTTAVAAAGVGMPYFVPSRVLAGPNRKGANDKFQIGFIGPGRRAQALILNENLFDHARIVAAADCFPRIMDEMEAKTEERFPGQGGWRKYHDHRDLLEKEKLDAVFVTTPTHARALICIHVFQAGMDVYAEKPLTLTIEEGRAIVNAAKKHKRILQVGSQQRSMPINRYASKLVREGAIGKIREVLTCNYAPGTEWEPKPGQPIPEGMNWDMWCNQTELRPFHEQLRTRWGLYWDYDGGGQSWGVTGWGTHALDQVQCALGTDDTGPVEIWPESEGPHCPVTMRYANGTLLKLANPRREGYDDLGAIFVGEKGTIEIVRGSARANPPELLKDAPPDYPSVRPGEVVAHFDNFFECMRTRKEPNAGAEIAHRATTVCHLVNACRDLGRKIHWDPVAEEFPGDEEANNNRMRARPRRKGYELPVV